MKVHGSLSAGQFRFAFFRTFKIPMHVIRYLLFLFVITFQHSYAQEKLNYHAVCFYYNWYGSPEADGKPYHWAHPVMPQNDHDTTKGFYPGGGDIGANYYPEAGEYSSADTVLLEKHMQQIASAGIGIIAVTWLGQDDYTYRSVPLILNAAARHNIKVCFQIEPRVRKTALTTRGAVEFLVKQFGNHPAFYKNPQTSHPMFFVYDSYVIPAKDWSEVFGKNGKYTIRNTAYDSDMIGLWVTQNEQPFFLESGFDGFYTYFASAGFTYGSTPSNWTTLQKWADDNNKIFIPSVGPGYIDTRVRPWNAVNTKDREDGAYYDRMFQAARDSKVKWIGITSFNEWHEGTQIEPAKPFSNGDITYKDYRPQKPEYYLKKTRLWLEKFK
jgi:glycoprotein endo-alpha-1,2-mannosidase